MASAQAQSGAKLLYRNVSFNSYSVLSVKDQFAKSSPEAIEAVIKAYEQARQWAKANPDKLAELLAREAKLRLKSLSFNSAVPIWIKYSNHQTYRGITKSWSYPDGRRTGS